jgi:hypothetical protein
MNERLNLHYQWSTDLSTQEISPIKFLDWSRWSCISWVPLGHFFGSSGHYFAYVSVHPPERRNLSATSDRRLDRKPWIIQTSAYNRYDCSNEPYRCLPPTTMTRRDARLFWRYVARMKDHFEFLRSQDQIRRMHVVSINIFLLKTQTKIAIFISYRSSRS